MVSYMALVLSAVLFLASHFGLSSSHWRATLVQRLGEKGFLAAYSLIALVSFGLLLMTYSHASHTDYLWFPSAASRHITFLLMPLVFVFFVCALWGRNPTAVQQESAMADPTVVRGIFRITRHPMMWAFALWAVLHAWANGDAATVVLAGTIGLLALLGTLAIDRRKQALGQSWQDFASKTSNLPFLAILQKRNQFVWAEIGWSRVGLGLALYILCLFAHAHLSGGVALF